MTLPSRRLGAELNVPAVGLGCMGMSDFYGPSDEAASLAVLDRAADLGSTFWDTSDMYWQGRERGADLALVRHPRRPGPDHAGHQVRRLRGAGSASA